MSQDVLDQSDIDALLQAAAAEEVLAQAPKEKLIFSRFRRDNEQVDIHEYDFKRPERISKDQIRALLSLHETFARNFGASLSGFLRTIVEVSVSHVEQMTYAEFIEGLPNPTSFSLLNPDCVDGQLCLEVSPLIIYPLIDRMLGGSTKELFIPQRPMTVIEMRVVQKILARAMTSLTEAWEGVKPIQFKLGEMESNPQLVQIVPPNEVVVVVRFELKMGRRAGTMSLCIPFNVIEPLIDELDAQNWFTSARSKAAAGLREAISHTLAEAGVGVSVVLAESTITLEDLRSLEVGDVITTEKAATSPVVVAVEGIPKFLANIGQFKGNRAVRVIRPIVPDERI